jgi:hypothetical protein
MKNPTKKKNSSSCLLSINKKSSEILILPPLKRENNNIMIKNRTDSPLNLRRENKSTTMTNDKLIFSKEYNNLYIGLLPFQYNINNGSPSNGEISNNLRKKPESIFKKNFKSCNRNLPNLKLRKDSYGILIQKGKKNHNIIFKDKLNTNNCLVETIYVESYKKENVKELDYHNDNNEKEDNYYSEVE